ncbi:MAG: MarR family transcriptional regulator [Pseudomonadota bacterium]
MNLSDEQKLVFQFFNEVGIIQQLSSTLFNRLLPKGLHNSHFSVLNHLTRLGDGRTPVEIARAFQVTKPTITNTLSTLVDRGFVRVVPNEKDGRSKLVFLTDAGRAFHLDAISRLVPTMQRLEGQLDFAAMAKVLPELVRIREILDKDRDP